MMLPPADVRAGPRSQATPCGSCYSRQPPRPSQGPPVTRWPRAGQSEFQAISGLLPRRRASPPRGTCADDILDQVDAYLDRELSDNNCEEVREHLDHCASCLREYGLNEAVRRLVQKHCGCSSAPASLQAKVLVRIRTATPACSRFHAIRQRAEQNRACSRIGVNGVPHCAHSRISAIARCYVPTRAVRTTEAGEAYFACHTCFVHAGFTWKSAGLSPGCIPS
jgi:mycothiol system anti-sigma-R factor